MDRVQGHLKEVWWLLMIRGIALILFGVVAVLWPGLTLVIIAAAFAAYLIIAGVVNLIVGVRAIGHMSLWFLTLLLGLAQIGVGIYLVKHNLVLATFIAVLGFSLIFYGILEVIAAFEPGEDSGRRFLLVIAGALSLIAGIVVILYPASSGLAFAWVLGLWALVSGAIQVAMCLSLHSKFVEADHRLREA
jgi:uncharacterized membrane protein HdeD (DUF308 family)